MSKVKVKTILNTMVHPIVLNDEGENEHDPLNLLEGKSECSAINLKMTHFPELETEWERYVFITMHYLAMKSMFPADRFVLSVDDEYGNEWYSDIIEKEDDDKLSSTLMINRRLVDFASDDENDEPFDALGFTDSTEVDAIEYATDITLKAAETVEEFFAALREGVIYSDLITGDGGIPRFKDRQGNTIGLVTVDDFGAEKLTLTEHAVETVCSEMAHQYTDKEKIKPVLH